MRRSLSGTLTPYCPSRADESRSRVPSKSEDRSSRVTFCVSSFARNAVRDARDPSAMSRASSSARSSGAPPSSTVGESLTSTQRERMVWSRTAGFSAQKKNAA